MVKIWKATLVIVGVFISFTITVKGKQEQQVHIIVLMKK